MLTLLLVEHALKMFPDISGQIRVYVRNVRDLLKLQLCYIEINIMVNTIHPMEVSTILGTDQGELTVKTCMGKIYGVYRVRSNSTHILHA